MHLDKDTLRTAVLAFNGELVGSIIEADTTDGYVVQRVYKHEIGRGVVLGDVIRKEGQVDFIGDLEKDSPRVLTERLNKIRSGLGLDLVELPPFLD